MSSTFALIDTGCNYFRKEITPSVILQLYRHNHSFAVLEFRDEVNNKINIPTGLVIYTKDDEKNAIQKPVNNMYALYWKEDYIVELNDKVLLDIKNKRMWEIISP
jgi:hypothetical protein